MALVAPNTHVDAAVLTKQTLVTLQEFSDKLSNDGLDPKQFKKDVQEQLKALDGVQLSALAVTEGGATESDDSDNESALSKQAAASSLRLMHAQVKKYLQTQHSRLRQVLEQHNIAEMDIDIFKQKQASKCLN